MSTLPDLQTQNISFVAYWNAIDDGGAQDINPEDVLTDGNINSYELYDNGIDITSYSHPGSEGFARVKSDGWIIAWFDRDHNYTQSTESQEETDGYWSVLNEWRGSGWATGFSPNALADSIQTLQSNLDNSNNISFNAADAGLYNYEHPDATNSTVGHKSDDTFSGTQAGFSYTSSTEIYAGAAIATTNAPDSIRRWTVSFEGVTIATSVSNDNDVYGSIDMLARNLIPDPGTEYLCDWNGQNVGQASGGVVLVWG